MCEESACSCAVCVCTCVKERERVLEVGVFFTLFYQLQLHSDKGCKFKVEQREKICNRSSRPRSEEERRERTA